MKRALGIIVLLLIILFGACGKRNAEDKSGYLQVYYAYTNENRNKGELIGSLDVPVSGDRDKLHIALAKLMENPGSEVMISAFPDNVKILSYEPKDDTISVNLSQSYRSMSPVERTVANACLVLTLCRFEDINAVSIYVEDALFESELTAEDIILPNYEETEYEKQLTLYFADTASSFLEKEKHLLTIGQNRQLVEYVIDELVRGPQNDNLRETLPKGTKILSIEVKKNICIVNLSKEFLLNRPETAAGERVAIYSIVNSITEITGIEAVQILVEGEKIDKYYLMSLYEPLTRDMDIVWQNNPDMTERVLTVYMAVNRDKLVALPVIVKANYTVSMEQNAVEAMLALKNKYGYFSIIPAGTRLNSIFTRDGVCYLDLSSEFSVEGETLNVPLAMKALAAAIIDTGNADYITISVEGDVIGEKIEKDESIILY
ncbi:MAG: GerMN domain-containing protein [Clostridiales bacterium]|nr:GerMN domain-containing protein [Clostridiales bacterium]